MRSGELIKIQGGSDQVQQDPLGMFFYKEMPLSITLTNISRVSLSILTHQ